MCCLLIMIMHYSLAVCIQAVTSLHVLTPCILNTCMHTRDTTCVPLSLGHPPRVLNGRLSVSLLGHCNRPRASSPSRERCCVDLLRYMSQSSDIHRAAPPCCGQTPNQATCMSVCSVAVHSTRASKMIRALAESFWPALRPSSHAVDAQAHCT